MRVVADPQTTAAACSHEHRFQPEIQGLRAVSVLAVIGAHAGLAGLPGGFTGVDVFFVISGFLITRLLLAEMERTGRIDLIAFWARRARRLLPNAFATLIGTVLLALLLFRGYDPGALAREITFAALEFANFHFAEKAVDYFRADGPASPVLHFWSLSVEEQFYLIWPLLLFAVGLSAGKRFRRAAAILLGAVWCSSFAASWSLTYTEQPLAYFGTGTRCWQLATGALLATGWQSVALLPQWLRRAMAGLGAAAIAGSMTLLDGVLYPGAWALLPTLGTAALIAGVGAAAPQGVLRRGLNSQVMQWIGARSYSWYVWHWPLLALPRIAYPGNPYIELVAVPASLAIACAAYAWIELPIRQGRLLAMQRPVPTLAGAAVALGAVIAMAHLHMPMLFLLNSELASKAAQVEIASRDLSQADNDKCHLERQQIEQRDCLYGDPAAPHRAVLFGDSHAVHWFPALNAAAKQAGWRFQSWTKTGCPSVDVRLRSQDQPYRACDEWRESIMARLQAEAPDLVVLSNRINYRSAIYDPVTGNDLTREESEEAWREGFRRVVRTLREAGTQVLIIRDVPRASKQYTTCLVTSTHCETPRKEALSDTPLDIEVAREFGDAVMLADFTDIFCGASTCPATQDGMIVYLDPTHLTATYAATFAPQLAQFYRAAAARLAIPSAVAEIGKTEP
jgi:peptidoglycan/LPS O-acetylase OafA/YrhL